MITSVDLLASDRAITLFDNVGFATEDFSAVCHAQGKLQGTELSADLDLLADPDDPCDLFGMLLRAKALVVRDFRFSGSTIEAPSYMRCPQMCRRFPAPADDVIRFLF